ncbi:T6SS effector phospholipase Tle3 domain-containing protein [Antarctobacter jejuensis]|uniref:T6SS effector phospholipase Tle3 domain-containing protein n=1 Tax=Antarctobacter jejuensis TaxID=1439938 RepID=UPI003FCFF58D
MPLLRITVNKDQAQVHGTGRALAPVLRNALRQEGGPVTIMVHGYKYLPGHPVHCPHGSLLSHKPRQDDWKIISWPGQLGLGSGCGEGLGISFGWSARGSIWAAHKRAKEAGHALADLIAQIRAAAPTRPISIVAHSLGARVALTAIRNSAPEAVRRAILLAAAEYGASARAALDNSHCEMLNVTTRENDLFDFLLERLIAPPERGDRMLGHGGLNHARLVTLQIDDPASLTALRRAGYPVAAPERLICHWSPYLRQGVFPLYRAVLGGDLSLDALRDLLPDHCAPRWSRLRPRLPRVQPPLLPAE